MKTTNYFVLQSSMSGSTYFRQDKKTHLNSCGGGSCMLWAWGVDCKEEKLKSITSNGNGLHEKKCKIVENDRIWNDEIRRMDSEETIIKIVERELLKWYGHVMQVEEDRWPKNIWEEDDQASCEKKTFCTSWLVEEWNKMMYKTGRCGILGWKGTKQLYKVNYYYYYN